MSNNTSKIDDIELLKKALVELRKTKAKLQNLENALTEPIAVIGLGCRFPGGSDRPEAFWEILSNGMEGRSEIPKDRWDIDTYYDPDPNTPGKMYTRYGNFLNQVDRFDPQFFGISPREANWLDPQQRLLLEVIWESLEYSALSPTKLIGSQTGVFLGMMTYDYAQLIKNSGRIEPFFASDAATAAGRVAHFLGVHGPTLTVETTCSSSLVACHLACQSLRNQECDLAIVAGVNLMLTPEVSLLESSAKMHSADGRCKAFDASADGMGRGEGCGVVVLKRLSDAIASGDNILAMIRGSAINHDGPSSNLTVPYGPAQEKLIRQALSNAQVEPTDVDYVECHGTGTPLGDPIEVEALASVYGKNRTQDRPLVIGSVKSNIGHLEGAAGIAGLIKVVLALQSEKIPPHLHLQQPSPRIPWNDIPVIVATEEKAWLKGERKRLAGISSFGISGTNTHMILEEAPSEIANKKSKIQPEDSLKRPINLLTLSAKTEKALDELVSCYHSYLETHQELDLADICYTANTGRTHFEHRLAVIASNQQELVTKLSNWTNKQAEATGVFKRQIRQISTPKVAFLFTGQGSQYVNMGKQLYQQASIFRQAVDQCDQILRSQMEKPLLSILYPQTDEIDSSLLDKTANTQVVLFVIEYALAQLWQSWGIKPDIVMGHSVGEYVAATIAGIFSLEDGLKLIAARGELMQKLPSGGEMVAVMASEERVNKLISAYVDKVTLTAPGISIAAINGPQSVVISGESEAIGALCNTLEVEGIKTKKLQVSHAFHSPLMEPMLADFEAVVNQLRINQPQIPVISNITGTRADKSIATGKYWVNHVREPVKFAQGMKTLHQEGYQIFLESGPKPILLGMGRQCLPEDVGIWLPSLRPGLAEWESIISSLGQLYTQGINVNWVGLYRDYIFQKVVLPTYPFQRQRYWIENSLNINKPNIYENISSSIIDLINQGDIEGLTQEISLAEVLTEDDKKLLPKLLNILVDRHKNVVKEDGVVSDYYNALRSVTEGLVKDEQEHTDLVFLTFGIFPEIVPGFSWLRLSIDPAFLERFREIALAAQQELRELCFAKVNFSLCQKVLDFGCGYGSDLIKLAKNHPHLQLTGYTIAVEQAKFAMDKINACQLQERVKFFNRDSSKDEFPESYDLVFGFEVAHHIKNKHDLFSNIGNHINEQGFLVLADFIANSDLDIDDEQTSSYFITKQSWNELLSQNHLQLIRAIDISQEIANYLYDPEFEENSNNLYRQNPDDNLRAAFHSYNQLGKLLRKELASYVLLNAQKQEHRSVEEIYQSNQEILNQLLSYSEVAINQWLYELEWKPLKDRQKDLTLGNIQNEPGIWLLFGEPNDLTQELTKALTKENKHCILVYPGVSYKQLHEQQYQLNPLEPEGFKHLLKEVLSNHSKLQGVVHLWNLSSSIEDLETAQKLGCGSVLYLLQTLVTASKIPPLWIVTQGAQHLETDSEIVQLQQAPVWGLSRVIAQEHPEIQCRRIDLETRANISEAVPALVREISNPDSEDQIAYRQGVRYVARLIRRQKSASLATEEFVLDAKSSYLITGGLGALGLEVAQWMVQKGARYIVLTGRRSPSATAQKIILQLETAGAKILVQQGDISQKQDVANIIEQLQKSFPPLRGVIHAAGVLDDGVLQQMNWERFLKVMAPKVQGAWHLHQLTQGLQLDFFVCFSSIASLIGSAGQGNYAAANAFMDALAHYRQGMGLHGLSINWGMWGKGGMAARLSAQAPSLIGKTGMSAIEPEQGCQVLEELLLKQVNQVGVFPINWHQFLQHLPSGINTVSLENFALTDSEKEIQKDEFLGQLIKAPESDRQQLLISYIQTKLGKLLGLPASQLPDPKLGFFDLGMDSLMAIELRNMLHARLGCSISTATLFSFSNIQDLTEYLTEKIFTGGLVKEIDVENSKDQEKLNVLEDLELNPQSLDEASDAITAKLQAIQNLLKGEN